MRNSAFFALFLLRRWPTTLRPTSAICFSRSCHSAHPSLPLILPLPSPSPPQRPPPPTSDPPLLPPRTLTSPRAPLALYALHNLLLAFQLHPRLISPWPSATARWAHLAHAPKNSASPLTFLPPPHHHPQRQLSGPSFPPPSLRISWHHSAFTSSPLRSHTSSHPFFFPSFLLRLLPLRTTLSSFWPVACDLCARSMPLGRTTVASLPHIASSPHSHPSFARARPSAPSPIS